MGRLRGALIFGICLFAGTTALAFDFKGVTVGLVATPEEVHQKLGVDCAAGAKGLQVCNGAVSFAGTVGRMNLVIGVDGVVQRISLPFESKNFSDVESAAIQKFGPPTSTTHDKLQNAAGAIFENVTHVWTATDGVEARLLKFAERADTSLLLFSTQSDRQMLQNNRQQRAKDF